MNNVSKVYGRPELVRSPGSSGVIQNTDTQGFKQFIAIRQRQKARDASTETLQNQVSELTAMVLKLTGAAHE